MHNLKYRRLHVLSDNLGQLLADAYGKFDDGDAIITAVPLHRSRLWHRGFNQARLLAEVVSRQSGTPLVSPLVRIKNTKPQFNLTRHLRRNNVAQAFALKAGCSDIIKDKKVILVDDVAATGSTVEECAKVLKQAGAKEVWALALARA